MLDLVAVGEVMLDVTAPELEPGRAVHGAVTTGPGGAPVNAALAAVAEGATACVVGRVGDDAVGRLIRETLLARGVEPILAIDPELPTGTFVAAGSAIAADRGANANLVPDDLPPRLAAGAVLVSPYAPPEVAAAAVARASAGWVAAADGNVAILDLGQAGGDAERALERLAGRYRLACVTLGAEGAVAVLDGLLERRRPPERLAEPATGAGDAFAAGLLLGLGRGLQLGAALELGCAVAVRFVRGRTSRSGTPSRSGSASAGP